MGAIHLVSFLYKPAIAYNCKLIPELIIHILWNITKNVSKKKGRYKYEKITYMYSFCFGI